MSSHRRATRPSSFAFVLLALPLFLPVAGCGGDGEEEGQSGALAAPTEFTTLLLPGPAVHLKWKDIANEDHYMIQRKEGAGAWGDLAMKEFSNDPYVEYHDAAVEAGKTYTYRVAAADKDAKLGAFSAEVSATVN